MGTKTLIGGAAAAFSLVACASAGEASLGSGLSAPSGAAQELLEKAAAPYVLLRSDIAHLDETPVRDAEAMREAHRRLASFDSRALAGSWVAYAALVAADQPAFADAIEAATKKPKRRAAFLARLRDDPASVRELAGAAEAIAAIRDVAARDATRINALGDRFIDDAYAMQSQGWAKKKIGTDGMSRVREAEGYAATRAWTPAAVTTKTRTKAGNTRPNLASDPTWTPEWSADSVPAAAAERTGALMTRALVLAARYATGDIQSGHVTTYAKAKKSDRCFTNAKLNLDQCIAATRTPYEEAFCLGEHALNDVSYCVGWVASAGRTK